MMENESLLSFWNVFFDNVYQYPADPTDNDKKNMYNFINNYGNYSTYPFIKKLYYQYIEKNGINLKNKNTFIQWVIDFYNSIINELNLSNQTIIYLKNEDFDIDINNFINDKNTMDNHSIINYKTRSNNNINNNDINYRGGHIINNIKNKKNNSNFTLLNFKDKKNILIPINENMVNNWMKKLNIGVPRIIIDNDKGQLQDDSSNDDFIDFNCIKKLKKFNICDRRERYVKYGLFFSFGFMIGLIIYKIIKNKDNSKSM